MCRDSDTGQYSKCQFEFTGYGVDLDVDVSDNWVHVTVKLCCVECEREIEVDNSWEIEQ